MSYSEYYLLGETGLVDEIEMRNGHGSMPVIWDYLFQKYCTKTSKWDNWMSSYHKLRAATPRMTDGERILFALGREPVMLPKALFPVMWEALELIMPNVPDNRVNHWPAVIEWMKKERDEEVVGFGMYATSVNDNFWVVQDPDEVDEDGDGGWRSRTHKEVIHIAQGPEIRYYNPQTKETKALPL